MAQKIILFLSTPNRSAKKVDYDCPGEGTVSGVQTYDAPVKYLLNTHKAVSEILCIVTSDAKEQSWKRFEKELVPEALRDAGRKSEEVNCIPIDFPENASIREILPQILDRTHEGDKILLETTGGLRNAMMYLLLISRALSYKGVETTCAVYSNYQPGKGIFRVEDVTEMLQVFDLIDGMQNLTSFGNVRVLQDYYQGCEDKRINNLLVETNQLWEYITLCRPNPVPGQIEKFNQALKAAEDCDDPLLRAFLPVFRATFEEEMTIPHLIRWCVNNDMVQQALTLYRQCVPDYIFNVQKNILAIKGENTSDSMESSERVEKAYSQFNKYLRMGGAWYKEKHGKHDYQERKKTSDDYTMTLNFFEKALERSDFTRICSQQELHIITTDFMYILTLRNMADHADNQTLSDQQALSEYLVKIEHYKDPEKTSVEDVKNAILKGLDHLALQPQKA